jgi:hypothetical protein
LVSLAREAQHSVGDLLDGGAVLEPREAGLRVILVARVAAEVRDKMNRHPETSTETLERWHDALQYLAAVLLRGLREPGDVVNHDHSGCVSADTILELLDDLVRLLPLELRDDGEMLEHTLHHAADALH